MTGTPREPSEPTRPGASGTNIDGGAPITIGGVTVRPGRKKQVEVPVAGLPVGAGVALPVLLYNGALKGPVLFLSAAVHGDEVNGVEIIRRVIVELDPKTLAGAVIAVPVVNVFGFITQSRYLPDRRDLNRSFPGSSRASMAGRLAEIFMREVVSHCDFGIDLHTGSHHRTNLPQIRTDLDDERARRLTHAFGPPIALHAPLRDGSLRQAAAEAGIPALLYEGGQALRFDHDAIRIGTEGVLRVLAELKMIEPRSRLRRPARVHESRSSVWMRSGRSGIFHLSCQPGELVAQGDGIGDVYDAFGKRLTTIKSRVAGMIVGVTRNPLVNKGDAVVHVAELTTP